MASTSTAPFGLAINTILKPGITSEDEVGTTSIAYFPDGQRMISGSEDKTVRRWDLQIGKEIEEAWYVCEEGIRVVAVSRDGQWVVTGGGVDRPELKACEVETGIVKTFEGHSLDITCIDISADSTLLASGSEDKTARIWNLDTGKLMAGPFESDNWVGAVRFSTDSKKLAVKSFAGNCLEVWDIKQQKLDVRVGEYSAKVAWTDAQFSGQTKTKTSWPHLPSPKTNFPRQFMNSMPRR
ncbi:WD40-repeat-containing domain protein [Suillus lakei]|nr:WD40-repeat-containing domain protein [Suillus lakei]